MQIAGVLLAVSDQPVEEIDHRGALRLVPLIFVQHQPAVAADRGTVRTWRVDDRELARRGAGELLGGRGGTRRTGQHEATVLVLEPCLGHVRLQHIGELDIPDGARGLLDGGRHGSVSGCPLTSRPGYRLALSDLARPLGAHRGQVVGKDVGRAASVRTVHDPDVLVGKADATVVSRERAVVPFLDLSQEDAGNRVRRQLELAV